MQQAKANGGSQKVGNVNVQIGDKEGIYAGSATPYVILFNTPCDPQFATA